MGDRLIKTPVGIPARRRGRRDVLESRRFEELALGLAAAFARVAVEEIDEEIERWMERIVLTLELDRSTLAQIDASTGLPYFSHQWVRPGFPPTPRVTNTFEAYPWASNKVILQGETMVFSSVDELPPEAARDRANIREHGPKSNVTVPIKVGGRVIGAAMFGAFKSERAWPAEIVRRLQMITEIFGYALERKRAAAEVLRLRSDLNHVSRVNTLGELAASFAHELNQPLAAILSNAEAIRSILESRSPDLKEIGAAIDDVIEDNNRASETIRGLRALFRREVSVKSTLQLTEVLSEISHIVRGDAMLRSISFALDMPQSLPQVLADRVQLQQAIINLVLNAFDAVTSTDREPREVKVQALQGAAGWVKILVIDSGAGIEPDVLPRIFETFFTTKRDGMGIGLSITQSIVEAHGGSLTASSVPKRGATFEIALPAIADRGA